MATEEVKVKGEKLLYTKVLIEYADTMGGVDLVNRHLLDYIIPRKAILQKKILSWIRLRSLEIVHIIQKNR